MDAFQGERVVEMRRRQREKITPIQRLRNVVNNLRSTNLATLLLITLFIPLTFADIFFNISRGFICSIPDVSLCEPVVPLG